MATLLTESLCTAAATAMCSYASGELSYAGAGDHALAMVRPVALGIRERREGIWLAGRMLATEQHRQILDGVQPCDSTDERG